MSDLNEYRRLFERHVDDAPRGAAMFEVTTAALDVLTTLEKIKKLVHNVQGSARDTVEEIKELF